MNATEPLGTGLLLLVDGRRAGPEPLRDPDELAGLLRDLGNHLEPDATTREGIARQHDGTSHALLLDEAYLIVHAFPDTATFSFKAFSRHAVPDVDLYGRVLTALRTGRFESAVLRRAAGMPRDPAGLARRLAGERAWARARLTDRPGDATA